MKSDNTEAITHIDRQIDEFEELLKELTSSKALLTSTKPVPPPPLAPGERRRGPAVLGMPMMSEEERQRNEQKIQRERQRLEAPYQAARRHQEDLERKYDAIYDDTEYALSRYFSPEGVLKQLRDNVVSNLHTQEKENDEQYRRDPRRYLVFGSPSAPIECDTIFAVFGRGEKLELVSKKSEDEMNISAGLAKKEKKLQA